MKYIFDHDYHIHSSISPCSNDPQQLPENILNYALKNNLHEIVLTDHFWDTLVDGDEKGIWKQVPYEVVSGVCPLPQAESTRFLFGCETDMDADIHLWFSSAVSLEERAQLWVRRFDRVLDSDLPFKKVGIAHLTCSLMANLYREAHLEVLRMIPDGEMERLFLGAKEKGCGIEINFDLDRYTEEEYETVLRPYQIAKACGCKFYIGSDAHTLQGLEKASSRFAKIINCLELSEDDKFHIVR